MDREHVISCGPPQRVPHQATTKEVGPAVGVSKRGDWLVGLWSRDEGLHCSAFSGNINTFWTQTCVATDCLCRAFTERCPTHSLSVATVSSYGHSSLWVVLKNPATTHSPCIHVGLVAYWWSMPRAATYSKHRWEIAVMMNADSGWHDGITWGRQCGA